jgi:hypothetical protein
MARNPADREQQNEMSRPAVRILVLAVSGALVMAAHASPAYAASHSEGRTFGAIARGVSGDVLVRRPGLSGADTYDMKMGARWPAGNKTFYVGFRSYPGGSAQYIVQEVAGSAISVSPKGAVTADSLTTVGVSMSAALRANELRIRTPVSSNTIVSTGNFDFDELYARSYMSNGSTFLSAGTSSRLQYVPAGLSGFTPWGSVHMQSVSFGSCGRFPSDSSWRYAHNGSC